MSTVDAWVATATKQKLVRQRVDLGAVVDVGGVQGALERVDVVLPGEDVALVEDPRGGGGAAVLFLGDSTVHERG